MEFRETHGVIPHAAPPERLDAFFESVHLLHVVTSLQHVLHLPTGRVSGCKRGSSSGRSRTSCRSSRSWLSLSLSYLLVRILDPGSPVYVPGIQEGVFPDPLDSLPQQVDPGVGVNSAVSCLPGPDHHGPCSLSLISIYIFFVFLKSAAV